MNTPVMIILIVLVLISLCVILVKFSRVFQVCIESIYSVLNKVKNLLVPIYTILEATLRYILYKFATSKLGIYCLPTRVIKFAEEKVPYIYRERDLEEGAIQETIRNDDWEYKILFQRGLDMVGKFDQTTNNLRRQEEELQSQILVVKKFENRLDFAISNFKRLIAQGMSFANKPCNNHNDSTLALSTGDICYFPKRKSICEISKTYTDADPPFYDVILLNASKSLFDKQTTINTESTSLLCIYPRDFQISLKRAHDAVLSEAKEFVESKMTLKDIHSACVSVSQQLNDDLQDLAIFTNRQQTLRGSVIGPGVNPRPQIKIPQIRRLSLQLDTIPEEPDDYTGIPPTSANSSENNNLNMVPADSNRSSSYGANYSGSQVLKSSLQSVVALPPLPPPLPPIRGVDDLPALTGLSPLISPIDQFSELRNEEPSSKNIVEPTFKNIVEPPFKNIVEPPFKNNIDDDGVVEEVENTDNIEEVFIQSNRPFSESTKFNNSSMLNDNLSYRNRSVDIKTHTEKPNTFESRQYETKTSEKSSYDFSKPDIRLMNNTPNKLNVNSPTPENNSSQSKSCQSKNEPDLLNEPTQSGKDTMKQSCETPKIEKPQSYRRRSTNVKPSQAPKESYSSPLSDTYSKSNDDLRNYYAQYYRSFYNNQTHGQQFSNMPQEATGYQENYNIWYYGPNGPANNVSVNANEYFQSAEYRSWYYSVYGFPQQTATDDRDSGIPQGMPGIPQTTSQNFTSSNTNPKTNIDTSKNGNYPQTTTDQVVNIKDEILREMQELFLSRTDITDRKQYIKQLQMKWHPDKNSDDDKEMSKKIFQFVQNQK